MSRMTDKELAVHLCKVHGITDETTYDPDIHYGVPAICFGPLVPSNRMVGDGNRLDPERDLVDSMLGQSAKAAQ